jgi:hypothetical protein
MDPEATQLFSKVFMSLSTAFSDSMLFRQMVLGGLPDVQRQLFQQNARWFATYVNDPENAAIFLDRAKFLEEVGGVAGAATKLTDQEIGMYEGSVDAASLVFMHSALDGASEDLCRVTAIVDPQQWYQFIGGQQECLSVLRENKSTLSGVSARWSVFAQRVYVRRESTSCFRSSSP